MLAAAKTSDFVFRELASGVLTANDWTTVADGLTARADGLYLPLPVGLRFRSIYIGWIFTGSPSTTQTELTVAFIHQGRELASWTLGQANGTSQTRDGIAPPFSVQEIALGSLSGNQPALAGGDVPGSIVISDYNLADGVQRYVRMTPLKTYQEADQLRISGRVYTSVSASSVFKLFAAVNSTAVNL